MEEVLNRERTAQIAHNAKQMTRLQDEIENAGSLIAALELQPVAELTVAISTILRQEGYRCQVSKASAICLLRESIEMKQQYIKTLSDWLRSALSE